jgi:phosphatidylglycerophosphate synthase
MAARSEHQGLLSSALTTILPVALAMVPIAVCVADWLQLSDWYVAKCLIAFGLAAVLLLRGLAAQHPFPSFGPGNVVTAVRGAVVILLIALVGEVARGGVAATVADAAAAAAAMACLLDGVDGWLARRSGMASRFGAGFDMETDAVLVAVLATLAWQFGKVGAWVLWAGALRYLYLAAGVAVPVLQRPLPPSPLRKSIAVAQVVALIAILLPLVSPAMSAWIAGTALAALTFSFLQQAILAYRTPVSGPVASC